MVALLASWTRTDNPFPVVPAVVPPIAAKSTVLVSVLPVATALIVLAVVVEELETVPVPPVPVKVCPAVRLVAFAVIARFDVAAEDGVFCAWK